MPNPNAPTEGTGRRILFLVDPDNPGTAYLQAGEGGIDMGAGRTEGAIPYVIPVKADTATRSVVAGTESETQLLAANSWRRGAILYNDGDVDLYLGLGSDAVSTTDFSVIIPAGGYWEAPYNFTGEIRGVWGTIGSGDTADAYLTELTTSSSGS